MHIPLDKKAETKHQTAHHGIYGDLGNLKGKNLKFESLSKTQEYIELLLALDNIERKRWYFGLKKRSQHIFIQNLHKQYEFHSNNDTSLRNYK